MYITVPRKGFEAISTYRISASINYQDLYPSAWTWLSKNTKQSLKVLVGKSEWNSKKTYLGSDVPVKKAGASLHMQSLLFSRKITWYEKCPRRSFIEKHKTGDVSPNAWVIMCSKTDRQSANGVQCKVYFSTFHHVTASFQNGLNSFLTF